LYNIQKTKKSLDTMGIISYIVHVDLRQETKLRRIQNDR